MRYVPILRTKDGELRAMAQTDWAVASHIKPLIEVRTAVGMPDEPETSKKIENLVKKLHQAWPWGEPCILDLSFYDGAPILLSAIVDAIRKDGPVFIPAVTTKQSPGFQAAMAVIAADIGIGVCFRIDVESKESVNADLAALRDMFLIPPEQIDIILDMGWHTRLPPLWASTLHLIINAIPDVKKFRSLVLAATTFPGDMGGFQAQAISTAPRGEWLSWKALIASPELTRIPLFGDYTAVYPEDVIFDPKTMRLGAKIKYTCEECWLIAKGRAITNTKKSKGYGYEQFRDLSRAIVSRPEYRGAGFSWGDAFIQACADGSGPVGNLTTWVAVVVNQHVAFVVHQLGRSIVS